MANTDYPHGFRPIRHNSGGEIRSREYILTTGATVFQGERLKVVAAGTVEQAAAADSLIVIGIAAEYADDSASAGGVTVAVYDDPDIVFSVQADTGTAVTAAAVFATAQHVPGTGNTGTGMSTDELDASDIGTGTQLEILGKVDTPGNDWAEHVELEVLAATHKRKAAVAGV